MNILDQFKKAKTDTNKLVSATDLLEKAVSMLDSHEGEQHVDCIQELFTPQAIRSLKEEGILEQEKFYTKRQAASMIWFLWKQM